MKTQKNEGRSTRRIVRLPETSYRESHIINVDNRGVSLGNGSYAKASYYSKYGYWNMAYYSRNIRDSNIPALSLYTHIGVHQMFQRVKTTVARI